MVGVDNNVNSVPKVSGTCFGKFEKSTQIDPKMFIFGHPDGCLTGVIGSIKASLLPAYHVKQRCFTSHTTGKVTEVFLRSTPQNPPRSKTYAVPPTALLRRPGPFRPRQRRMRPPSCLRRFRRIPKPHQQIPVEFVGGEKAGGRRDGEVP